MLDHNDKKSDYWVYDQTFDWCVYYGFDIISRMFSDLIQSVKHTCTIIWSFYHVLLTKICRNMSYSIITIKSKYWVNDQSGTHVCILGMQCHTQYVSGPYLERLSKSRWLLNRVKFDHDGQDENITLHIWLYMIKMGIGIMCVQ